MKHTIIFLLFLLTACSSLSASNNNDYNLLFSSLLNINNSKYTFIDKNGERQPDQLKKFKDLEKIYIEHVTPDLANKKFSKDRLKIIMFYSFYAHEKKSAAFQEYLASDLMPIYIENKNTFFNILNELPFLIPSNCDRLNSFFGFEGKNINNKAKFMDQNKYLFKKNLNQPQFKACINYFKD